MWSATPPVEYKEKLSGRGDIRDHLHRRLRGRWGPVALKEARLTTFEQRQELGFYPHN